MWQKKDENRLIDFDCMLKIKMMESKQVLNSSYFFKYFWNCYINICKKKKRSWLCRLLGIAQILEEQPLYHNLLNYKSIFYNRKR